MYGFTVVSDSLRGLRKYTLRMAIQESRNLYRKYHLVAIQVQVIESRWTDKAYNHGLAWRSHSPNRSTGLVQAVPSV